MNHWKDPLRWVYARVKRPKFVPMGDTSVTLPQREFGDIIQANRVKDEESVFDALRPQLHQSSVFYDIGANMGAYAVAASRVTDCTAFAFEPRPDTADKCQETIKLNGVDVHVFALALSDSNGTARMTDPREHGSSQITESADGYDVEMVRGDDLIQSRELPPPSVMKIDVEGHELAVLEGFEKTLSGDQPPFIVCEVHTDLDVSVDSVRTRLEADDYTTEVRSHRDIHPLVVAKPP